MFPETCRRFPTRYPAFDMINHCQLGNCALGYPATQSIGSCNPARCRPGYYLPLANRPLRNAKSIQPPETTPLSSMKRRLVSIASFVCFLACILMGIFSALGVCAAVFGGEIVDTVLSANPEPSRSHPAFIFFMLLMVPGMLVGAIGGLFGFVLPLHQRFQIPIGRRSNATRRWLHSYAQRLVVFTESKNGNPPNK